MFLNTILRTGYCRQLFGLVSNLFCSHSHDNLSSYLQALFISVHLQGGLKRLTDGPCFSVNSGIGIVNAIEVVNAFPGEEGLKSFKKWVESPDLSLLGLQGKGTKTKGGHLKQKAHQVGNKVGYAASNGDEMVEDDSVDGITDVGDGDDVGDPDIKVLQQEFMEKHRAVSKNWNISASFPSEAVVAAYTNPQVDKSTDPFTWGRPDLESLRKFCNERFSWAKDKADELLLPVLKEYDRREVSCVSAMFLLSTDRPLALA
jgi:DNA excision repair protein ERCC-5